jgi:hypothetical protein
MKQPSTRTLVIVAVVVVLAGLGIGLCVRGIRSRHQSGSDKVQDPAQIMSMPGSGGGDVNDLSPEQRAELVEDRAQMMERFANMPEEEKEKFRAKVREKFAAKRQEGGPRSISEEDRTKLEEERDKMRQIWESMSEEERQEYRARMRERLENRR